MVIRGLLWYGHKAIQDAAAQLFIIHINHCLSLGTSVRESPACIRSMRGRQGLAVTNTRPQHKLDIRRNCPLMKGTTEAGHVIRKMYPTYGSVEYPNVGGQTVGKGEGVVSDSGPVGEI